MSYQLVAGPYDTIDVTELAEGEGAVITEDDPTTESGHGTYVCMGGSVAQRILTAEDIMDGWAMCYLKPSQFDAETGQPTLENPNDETIYHTLVDGVWKKWTHSNGTWTEINEGEVTGANLADNSVSENKLVDGCVTGSKVAAGAIDSSKLSQTLRDSINRTANCPVTANLSSAAQRVKALWLIPNGSSWILSVQNYEGTEIWFRNGTTNG